LEIEEREYERKYKYKNETLLKWCTRKHFNYVKINGNIKKIHEVAP
jgi:hypothetical protein